MAKKLKWTEEQITQKMAEIAKEREQPINLGPSDGHRHDLDVLWSWMQKSIRRGLEEDAVYCAVALDLLGETARIWTLLRRSASEDIGLGCPTLPAVLDSLHQSCFKDKVGYRLYIVHGVLLCCRAPKSRLVDDMLSVFYNDPKEATRPEPDWALDKHTKIGALRGCGVRHFFEEGTKLARAADIPNPYTERAKQVLMDKEAKT